MAALVQLERTIPAVDNTRAALQLKESIAVDRNVKGLACLADRAFVKCLRQASGEHALPRRRRQRTAIKGGKLGVGILKSGSVDVGNIVADCIDVGLSRMYTRQIC